MSSKLTVPPTPLSFLNRTVALFSLPLSLPLDCEFEEKSVSSFTVWPAECQSVRCSKHLQNKHPRSSPGTHEKAEPGPQPGSSARCPPWAPWTAPACPLPAPWADASGSQLTTRELPGVWGGPAVLASCPRSPCSDPNKLPKKKKTQEVANKSPQVSIRVRF